MDGELKRELLAKIDKYVTQMQKENSELNIAHIMKPEVERLAKEYDVDMVDLFVAYMDHVAIDSKNNAQENEEDLKINRNILFGDKNLNI